MRHNWRHRERCPVCNHTIQTNLETVAPRFKKSRGEAIPIHGHIVTQMRRTPTLDSSAELPNSSATASRKKKEVNLPSGRGIIIPMLQRGAKYFLLPFQGNPKNR